MNILVSGGAGYVGSHAVRLLQKHGHTTWIYDNLFQGHKAAVPAGCLIEGELRDARMVDVSANRYFYFLLGALVLLVLDILISIRTVSI